MNSHRLSTVAAWLAFWAIPALVSAHGGNTDPNVVHACIANASQIVRIVGVNGVCISAPASKAETPAHWQIAGPQGPPGQPGATGPAGPQGPPGPAGVALRPIIWSGGCSHEGVGTDVFVRYCTDSLDFNTAGLHLTSTPTGVFTVNVAGFYRINFFAVSNICGAASVRLLRNSQPFHWGVESTSVNLPTDNFAHAVWLFQAGDSFEVEVWSGNCGVKTAYFAWNAEWGATSRLQLEYLGPVE